MGVGVGVVRCVDVHGCGCGCGWVGGWVGCGCEWRFAHANTCSAVQASVLASQERLQYVAAFGDKKEYIALIELQLNRAR